MGARLAFFGFSPSAWIGPKSKQFPGLNFLEQNKVSRQREHANEPLMKIASPFVWVQERMFNLVVEKEQKHKFFLWIVLTYDLER